MSTGPFLYDDGPPNLHTGTPRRRQLLIVGLLVGTVLVALGMVAAMLLVRGTPEEQAREAAGVFLAALEHRDTETAYGLLCEAERARISPEGVGAEYARAEPGTVVGSTEATHDGERAERVEVRWADGETSALVVVPESGPRICGTA